MLKGISFVCLLLYSFFSISIAFLLPLFLLAKQPDDIENILTGRLQIKLTLTYYQNIFCSRECRKYVVEGCSGIIGQPDKLMCREQAELIRSGSLVEAWRQEQRKQGYIDFTIEEFGIKHAKAHMNYVTPFMSELFKKDSGNANTQLVTGVFKRHSVNVNLYTFQNLRTGELSSIHVTPEHLFYSKNRQGFLPLGGITARDILMTGNGDNVKLVYSGRNIRTTSDSSANIPRLVYNLEIQKKHIYFAGQDKIMVHNTCKCGICREGFESPNAVKVHIRESHAGGVVSYLCGINGCTQKRLQINYINIHQMEAHSLTNVNSCGHCGKQLDDAEELLQHIRLKHTGPAGSKKPDSGKQKDPEHVTVTRSSPVFRERNPRIGASLYVPDLSKENWGNASEMAEFWAEAYEQTFFNRVEELMNGLDDAEQ